MDVSLFIMAKKPLSPTTNSPTTSELFEQLCVLVASLHKPTETKEFLEHFFTAAEQTAFAKRLGIAQQLGEGNSYEEIAKNLKVSSATISTVGTALKSSPVQSAMRYLAAENWMRRLLRRST